MTDADAATWNAIVQRCIDVVTAWRWAPRPTATEAARGDELIRVDASYDTIRAVDASLTALLIPMDADGHQIPPKAAP